jgi:hypothetical protein
MRKSVYPIVVISNDIALKTGRQSGDLNGTVVYLTRSFIAAPPKYQERNTQVSLPNPTATPNRGLRQLRRSHRRAMRAPIDHAARDPISNDYTTNSTSDYGPK